MSGIDAYCARIGHAGPRAPSLPVLQAIVAAHTAAIPFENIDVQLGRGLRLDAGAIADKLVRQQRGGYCCEHNLLLMDMLSEFGFAVTGLAGRVQRGRPPGFVATRTHMLLRVDLPEGTYLADVGYGALTPTAPLLLEPDRIQETPHETFRLVAGAGHFDLEAMLGGAWSVLYRFSLEPQARIDYEVANWYTSTHPDSLFVRHLVATRPAPGCRYTLFDDKFAIRGLDGRAERRRLDGADDLAEVLARHFGLDLPAADIAALAARNAGRELGGDPFEGPSPPPAPR